MDQVLTDALKSLDTVATVPESESATPSSPENPNPNPNPLDQLFGNIIQQMVKGTAPKEAPRKRHLQRKDQESESESGSDTEDEEDTTSVAQWDTFRDLSRSHDRLTEAFLLLLQEQDDLVIDK